MTLLSRFSIVVVPFPYADQLAEKRRPALVISSDNRTSSLDLIWVAMITSEKNQGWADDIAVSNFAACGLPAPSVLRPMKIATIDAARVIRVLGRLETVDCQKVLQFYQREFAHFASPE